MRIVITAKIKLCTVGLAALFPMFPIATGIKVKPIVVMTDPVTIDGKRLAILEKKPETRMT